jgi:hypothetical protein
VRGVGKLIARAVAKAREAIRAARRTRKIDGATRFRGRHNDPYLFIRSKGRNGAAFRAKLMAARMPKVPSGMSLPFKSKARNDAFLAAAAAGEPRNAAMKIARRVPA